MLFLVTLPAHIFVSQQFRLFFTFGITERGELVVFSVISLDPRVPVDLPKK